jgi:arylsulfatase
VPDWASLSENQKKFAARLQEAFAAMLEHTDAQIGRLVDFLERRGLLENTLLMVLSDNGASREGGPFGVMDEFSFFNAHWEDVDAIVENHLDDIGGPHSHSNYPWGWAQAGNSPLRWYKQNTYGGGVRDPLVVHWPARINDRGALRPQFCHAVDIAPTILEAVGLTAPTEFNGVSQIPMHGAAITATFDDAAAPPPRSVQYFEQMGHRGLWADGWKVTTYHEPGHPFDDDEWGLYHLDEDFSECHDVAAEHPEKLRELIDAWWVEAGANGVMPLDDRTIELFTTSAQPASPHDRRDYVYYPPVSHVPADASPPLGGRNWTITATVDVPEGGVEGVLYARGGHNVGHSFFIADNTLHFDYNALGVHHRVSAPIALAPGEHVIAVRFERDGEGGAVTIAANGEDLASVEIPKIVRMLGSTGLSIGRDALSPVVDDYEPPFAFTGTIDRIVFAIRSRADAAELAAIAKAELAKE